ncbi:MAG: WD40 repeat domain-containing protein [Leptolyngbyaceae cyanobacterium SL_7_1]|nr:WD40 repeat domain-containing protein [Leptolyngbyaceae cyanobacterium SL_7_1]
MAASRDGQIASSSDRPTPNSVHAITLWNPQTQQIRQTLAGHRGIVRSLSFSADGQILASGSDDTTIRLWDVSTGELIQTLEGHTAPVLSVVLSADGATLVSGSADQSVRLWNLSNATSQPLLAHTDAVHAIALSPDGGTIASSGADKTIRLWHPTTRELIRTLGEPGGHRDVINTIAFSPDGQQLVSGSWDKSVKIWDTATGQLRHTLEGHTDRVTAACLSIKLRSPAPALTTPSTSGNPKRARLSKPSPPTPVESSV